MKRIRHAEGQLREIESKSFTDYHGTFKESAGKEDRLSNLPDDILYEIVSYLSTKEAVQTCILSKRWKDLWKTLPVLRLHSRDFKRTTIFNRFLSGALSLRNKSTLLHSIDFNRHGRVEPRILNKVVKYAVSYPVQELKMTFSLSFRETYYEFPPSFFSCQNSLTSLEIFIHDPLYKKPSFPKSLNMPCLTNLRLSNFAFSKSENMDCAEPFSNCKKLKTLIIRNCVVKGKGNLCISNATVANLTICFFLDPLIDNYKIELSTPNLCSLSFMGFPALPLAARNISCLKQVDIDARSCRYCSSLEGSLMVISWLKVLVNVTSLTLSWSTIQDISTLIEGHDTQPPCFSNLKTLKVGWITADDQVNNLLRNSPYAEVTVIRD